MCIFSLKQQDFCSVKLITNSEVKTYQTGTLLHTHIPIQLGTAFTLVEQTMPIYFLRRKYGGEAMSYSSGFIITVTNMGKSNL